jgi:hypothetical protein
MGRNYVYIALRSRGSNGFGYPNGVNYQYSFDGTNCYYSLYTASAVLITNYTVTDDYQKHAYVARSRTKGLGAAGLKYAPFALTHGAITNNVSLQDATLGFVGGAQFTDIRSDHSGEFTKTVQNTVPFYKALLQTGFLIAPPP